MTSRTGRPPSDDPRTEVVTLRYTKEEKAIVELAAAAAGLKLGPWLREVTTKAAKRAARQQPR